MSIPAGKITSEKAVAAALVSFGLLWILFFNLFEASTHQHFAWLASSFWQGRLDIPADRILGHSLIDITVFSGRYYWPLGPLPAVMMMPLVPFFGGDAQSLAQILLAAGLAGSAYILSRRVGLNQIDSVWLSFLFCFGSVTIGVISLNGPWYIGNSMAALCLLLALVESRTKDRPAAIGGFIGLAWLTRMTAGLGAIYFFLCELLRPGSRRAKAGRIIRMAIPVLAAIALLGLYDYLRFGDLFNSGYDVNFLSPLKREAADRAQYGLFSQAFWGRNLFTYFLMPPQIYHWLPLVSPYGVSFFLLSPTFLLAAGAWRRRPEFLAAAAGTAAVLAVLLSYFATGYWQFGPRYLLDILPYWFLLLLFFFRERGLRRQYKIFIAASAGVNVFLYVLFTLHYVHELI